MPLTFALPSQLQCSPAVAGTASNHEVEFLLTVSFLNNALGLE